MNDEEKRALNVDLARLATEPDEEKEKALRQKRKDAGLSDRMDRTEIAIAVNTISREAEMEGDDYIALLEAVEKQEAEEKPEATEKLFASEIVVLKEALALNEDGTINVCLITPGWGNSGYYSESLLKNSVGVFSEGLHMYWDHPTVSEEFQRPERSLRDLAGVLAMNAEWREQGFGGPGIYSTSKVFSPYMENLDEMAPYIGISVVVYGLSHVGEVDGTTGDIIDAILAARSADFVTLPARGGKVEAKFESLKESTRIKQLIESGKGGEIVDEATAKALKEQNEDLTKKLEESEKREQGYRDVALKSASDKLVESELAEVKSLPDASMKRVLARLTERPIIKDDKVDEEGVKTAVAEAVKAEKEFLAELGLDKVTDLGPTRQNGNDPEFNEKEYTEGLEGTFQNLGLSEEAAKIAARGRPS